MMTIRAEFGVEDGLIDFAEFEAVTGLVSADREVWKRRRVPHPVPGESWSIKRFLVSDAPAGCLAPDLMELLEPLRRVLEGSVDVIPKYCRDHGLSGYFKIVVNSEDGRMPLMRISPGFLALMKKLDIGIDFDFYLWLGEEWAERERAEWKHQQAQTT
jgi:hypothetical protein